MHHLAHTSSVLTLLASVLLAVTGSAQGTYTITDLGTLPGGTYSEAHAINEHGQIVGAAQDASGNNLPVLWDNGTIMPLGTLGGATGGAVDINNAGQVVGSSAIASGTTHAFLWDAGSGMRDLGTLSGNPAHRSAAGGINDNGEVAGNSELGGILSNAFRWDPTNGLQDLGRLPGGNFVKVFDINDNGEISGAGDATGTGYIFRSFRYDPQSGFTQLSTAEAEGRAISRNGAVAGFSTETSTTGHTVEWQGTTLIDHGLLPGAVFSDAFDINDSGLIVGASRFPNFSFRALLWDGQQLRDLNNLIPPGTGWTLEFGFGINEAGQIVGRGTINGEIHAFLLDPPARVHVVGGQIGGALSFQHHAPNFPNELAITLLSLSGASAAVPLPGGLTVRLNLDAATIALLGLPPASIALLDGSGSGQTTPISLPRRASLAGLPAWVASVVFDSSARFAAASTTVPFAFQ